MEKKGFKNDPFKRGGEGVGMEGYGMGVLTVREGGHPDMTWIEKGEKEEEGRVER